jgi:DNA mismatch repair protein MSH4
MLFLRKRSQIQGFQANCNPLLDVARETYKENVGDINDLHRSLTEKHGLPMQLVYQESGFLFSIKKGDLVEEKLPWGFTNVSMQKGRWLFTSMELVSNEDASNMRELILVCNFRKNETPG